MKYVCPIFIINHSSLIFHKHPKYLEVLIIPLKKDFQTHCKKATYKKPQQKSIYSQCGVSMKRKPQNPTLPSWGYLINK